jgi:hypothetical protein
MPAADRYVILGVHSCPPGELLPALHAAGATIVDEMPDRALLVSGSQEAIRAACAPFPDVRIVPERWFKLGS